MKWSDANTLGATRNFFLSAEIQSVHVLNDERTRDWRVSHFRVLPV